MKIVLIDAVGRHELDQYGTRSILIQLTGISFHSYRQFLKGFMIKRVLRHRVKRDIDEFTYGLRELACFHQLSSD